MLRRYLKLFIIVTLFSLTSIAITATPMESAFVRGTVVDAATGTPIANAGVGVNAGTTPMTTTDADGSFVMVLPVANEYNAYTIWIAAEGYGTWTMTDSVMYPNVRRLLGTITLTDAPQEVFGGGLPGALIRTEADIEAAQRANPVAADATYVPQGIGVPNISETVIPLTIKVGITGHIHCGTWLNAGQPVLEVIEMDFQEYVKNVLPNEWVSAWGPESLKTGAMAVKMFAWWRMTLTNPRPKGADVVDNTCDQVFIRNSERDSTNAAVEATWPYRMVRNNQVVEIHFLSHDGLCAQYGWPNCIGQRDSNTLAEQGWTYTEILARYFPDFDILDSPIFLAGQNLIQNGGFDDDITHWSTFGSVEGASVMNGVFQFYRTQDDPDPAVLLQDMDFGMPEGAPVRVRVRLGNSSSSQKIVGVHLHSVDNWDGVLSCAFTVPPQSEPLNYTLWAETTTSWRAVRLEIMSDSADGLPYQLIDDVRVTYEPENYPGEGVCEEPAPGKPKVVTPIDGNAYDNNLMIQLDEGRTNYRIGYDAGYEVQVLPDGEATEPIFTSAGDLSGLTNIAANLADGTYTLRARQFDGIDRYSDWTDPVTFVIGDIPSVPVAVAPMGDIDGNDVSFIWSETANTTTVKLVVKGSDNKTVGKFKGTQEELGCAAQCVVTAASLGLTLLDGEQYTWKVVVKNDLAKAKTAKIPFVPDVPGDPTLYTPINDAAIDTEVVFEWRSLDAADFYRLRVKPEGSPRVINAKVLPDACDADRCTVTLASLGVVLDQDVTYTWFVKAKRKDPKAKSSSEKWTFQLVENDGPNDPPGVRPPMNPTAPDDPGVRG